MNDVMSQQARVIELLQVENDRLRTALEAVEWIDGDYGGIVCWWCENEQEDGHKPDCQRQAALGLASPPVDTDSRT